MASHRLFAVLRPSHQGRRLNRSSNWHCCLLGRKRCVWLSGGRGPNGEAGRWAAILKHKGCALGKCHTRRLSCPDSGAGPRAPGCVDQDSHASRVRASTMPVLRSTASSPGAAWSPAPPRGGPCCLLSSRNEGSWRRVVHRFQPFVKVCNGTRGAEVCIASREQHLRKGRQVLLKVSPRSTNTGYCGLRAVRHQGSGLVRWSSAPRTVVKGSWMAGVNECHEEQRSTTTNRTKGNLTRRPAARVFKQAGCRRGPEALPSPVGAQLGRLPFWPWKPRYGQAISPHARRASSRVRLEGGDIVLGLVANAVGEIPPGTGVSAHPVHDDKLPGRELSRERGIEESFKVPVAQPHTPEP